LIFFVIFRQQVVITKFAIAVYILWLLPCRHITWAYFDG